jgi:Xaa-Pro aminopeptidase
MSSYLQRVDRLTPLLLEHELDALVVTDIVNVRYLCGFEGTNGVCVIGPQQRIFVTDFRYAERARSEVPDYDIVQGKQDLLGDVAGLIGERATRDGFRVGFEDANLTVSRHARFAKLLPDACELVPAGGLVQRLRAVKDEDELAAIRAATELADGLYRWLIDDFGLAGHSERDVARALERRAQDVGADAVSFPPIVAAGANGALPHASPGDGEIPCDTLVVVDLGCVLDGYCSDCTRTFATGDVDDEMRSAYELVHSAQSAAVAAVRAGAEVAAVDAAARDPIEAAGQGERFGHGTGHGVGLEVHEEPRVARAAEGSLEAGNVVTIEPGVYMPGRFGIRIEDLVVVTDDGCETLTSIPRELTSIQVR